MAKQGLFVYKGRDNTPDATFLSGECAMTTASSGLLGSVKQNAKFAYGVGPAALLPGRSRRAAEHRHRRRQPVGHGRQASPTNTRASPRSSTTCRRPEVQSASHKRTGYLPITTAAFKLTEKSRLLQAEPRRRRGREPDDPQDDRQVARHPPRQLPADPHHHRRGARAGLGRQEERQGSARRRRSSAATSSSSASRRPTSPEDLAASGASAGMRGTPPGLRLR